MFIKNKSTFLVFIVLSFTCHAVLFGASYVLWPILHPKVETHKLASGPFLSCEVSFLQTTQQTSTRQQHIPQSKTVPLIKKTNHSANAPKNSLKAKLTPRQGSSYPTSFSAPPSLSGTAPSVLPNPGNLIPTYPEQARSNGQEAICHMRLFINSKGFVEKVIIDEQGINCMPVFMKEATKALLSWRFTVVGKWPSQNYIEKTIPITFRLDNE